MRRRVCNLYIFNTTTTPTLIQLETNISKFTQGLYICILFMAPLLLSHTQVSTFTRRLKRM